MSLGAKSRGRRRPQADAGGHSPPRAFAPGALSFCGRNAFPSVGRRTIKTPRRQGGPAGLLGTGTGEWSSFPGITPGEGELSAGRFIHPELYATPAHGELMQHWVNFLLA